MVHLFGVVNVDANKEVNEITSVCVANGSGVFVCPLFYRTPVQKLRGFPFCPY
jgi:hypothetical protein